MPLIIQKINTFTREKNGSVNVTIMHQKHLVQSGCSIRSAVNIFNTLCVFTKKSIREQEIKLECMNVYHFNFDMLYGVRIFWKR